MTTTITVEAHHALTKCVQIDVRDGERTEYTIIEDGQKATFYAYEDREIVVRERLKVMPLGPYDHMHQWQQRVCTEKDELTTKYEALDKFIQSGNGYAQLPVEERERLLVQRNMMNGYLRVLIERIGAFKGDRHER